MTFFRYLDTTRGIGMNGMYVWKTRCTYKNILNVLAVLLILLDS